MKSSARLQQVAPVFGNNLSRLLQEYATAGSNLIQKKIIARDLRRVGY